MAAHDRSIVAAILVAAGAGERLGADRPKAFVPVAGATLLQHTYARFAGHPAIGSVIVVVPDTHLSVAAELVGGAVVAGGPTRQASVAAGLAAVPAPVRYVLVHDVARPFVPDSVVTAVVDALRAGAAAVVPTLPIHDTVRRRNPDGTLAGVIDRDAIVAAQTPQGFARELLARAHGQALDSTATDDAVLVEALGHPVAAVPGSPQAFKITTADDLARAEQVARLLSAPHPAVTAAPGGIS